MYTHAHALSKRARDKFEYEEEEEEEPLLGVRRILFETFGIVLLYTQSRFCFSPFCFGCKRTYERSLSSKRGAASSPYFSTLLLFLVPNDYTKSSCFSF